MEKARYTLKYVVPGEEYTLRNRNGETVDYTVFQFAQNPNTAQGFIVYVESKGAWRHCWGVFFLQLAAKLIGQRVQVIPIGVFEQEFHPKYPERHYGSDGIAH